jgi:plasmid stabilization system protein ParE
MRLYWTNSARLSFFEILDHLQENWTEKEVENFVWKVEKTLLQISENPLMFKTSRKNKEIRKGYITGLTSIYYRVKPRKKEIEILAFFVNRKRPLTLS